MAFWLNTKRDERLSGKRRSANEGKAKPAEAQLPSALAVPCKPLFLNRISHSAGTLRKKAKMLAFNSVL
jgi:hypothetical protein